MSAGQSKLANILFAKQLAKDLEGSNVKAYSLHPGKHAHNPSYPHLLCGVIETLYFCWQAT